MVYDELVMDKETGELIPATMAIKRFYKKHGNTSLKSWTDEYILTGKDADILLDYPDFTKTLNTGKKGRY